MQKRPTVVRPDRVISSGFLSNTHRCAAILIKGQRDIRVEGIKKQSCSAVCGLVTILRHNVPQLLFGIDNERAEIQPSVKGSPDL